MWPFKDKCFYCKKESNLNSVRGVDIYDDSVYHYHLECLCAILSNPEENIKYVDRAIVIQDCITTRKKWKESLLNKCKKAHEEICI